MINLKKKLSKLFIVFTLFVLLAATNLFAFRNTLTRKLVNQKTATYNRSHTTSIAINNIHFTGIRTLKTGSVTLLSANNDTLINASGISLKISLAKTLMGKIGIRQLDINDLLVNIDKKLLTGRQANILPEDASAQSGTPNPVNLRKKSTAAIKQLFRTIPLKTGIKNAHFIFRTVSVPVMATVHRFELIRGRFRSNAIITGNGKAQEIRFEGELSKTNHRLDMNLYTKNDSSFIVSPLAGLAGCHFSYKHARLSIEEKPHAPDYSTIEATYSVIFPTILHQSISDELLTFPSFSAKLLFHLHEQYIEIDSISKINIGKLIAHPYVRYSKVPVHCLEASCFFPGFTPEMFFESLPKSLFMLAQNIEATGNLSYKAGVKIDFTLPDSLKIESKLTTDNFKISRFDEALLKMNTSFVHTVYEKGKTVRQIIVGEENPDFVHLHNIPALLQTAVLYAEDDAFFYSRGFSVNAMQRALAQNIKERRFARGGSTISMQLVKNVYLSRDKTIARKLEELIMVWLIESNRLVTKQRMFEVYLNIIEWGPGVYGASEAARFYFSKDVSKLNAAESIFLASVIPSPKKFYYRFDKEGKMAPFEREYFYSMSERLAKLGHLPTANADSLIALLQISGPAENYFRNSSAINYTTEYPKSLFEE
ncbi:MAG: transglycosylase domain-containing protein [Bacteroidales bacterium]|nr:transglycosylase domain-containing protein [Bacteroidales bacterium]